MSEVVVTTRDELAAATKRREPTILVQGKLADDLRKVRKLRRLGIGGLIALGGLIGLTPFTGGLSAALGFSTAAALTGMEISLIIVAACIGISLLIAIFRDYEEVEAEASPKGLRLKLKRPRKTKSQD